MSMVMVASISSSASALVQSGTDSHVPKSTPKQPWPCEVKLKETEPLIFTVAHWFQLIICFTGYGALVIAVKRFARACSYLMIGSLCRFFTHGERASITAHHILSSSMPGVGA